LRLPAAAGRTDVNEEKLIGLARLETKAEVT
jgi:hypothetical protein